MGNMYKTIKAKFITCGAPAREIPLLEPHDYREFSMGNEAWPRVKCLEELDSYVKTTVS